jgi:hypothetical protein
VLFNALTVELTVVDWLGSLMVAGDLELRYDEKRLGDPLSAELDIRPTVVEVDDAVEANGSELETLEVWFSDKRVELVLDVIDSSTKVLEALTSDKDAP